MAKADKEYQLRMDGMAYALKLAKEKGIEELEKEVKFRNARFIPLEFSMDAVRKANEEIAGRVVATLMATVFWTLHNSFKFGGDRLKKFEKAFYDECDLVDTLDPYGEHFVTIRDFAEELNNKYQLGLNVDLISKVESENDNRRKENN